MKPTHILLAAILAATSAIQAATAKHELPAPMPEFKTPEQLAIRRKEMTEKAKAADALAAKQAYCAPSTSAFYTGKPYLQETGSYVFKYRNYDPELNRWTSADPSGFPDGVNNLSYGPNPLSQLDATGLVSVDVIWTPQTGNNGRVLSMTVSPPEAHPSTPDAEMVVSWHVNSAYSGWIVQHVTFDLTGIYNNTDNSQYSNGPTSYNYLEAWQVSKGAISPMSIDVFTMNAPSSTHGKASITGHVTFFQNSVFSNLSGNDNPANWVPGVYVSETEPAGGLVATTTFPAWWSDSGTYNHNMEMTWTE